MSLNHGAYVGAKACTKGPTPGAMALEAWHLGAYKNDGARNDGVYNCRDQRGSSALSVHGEGRAADLGCPKGAAWAKREANALVRMSAELGVQCVIFNRRIWSCAHWNEGWRPYGGVDPHDTHLHVELTWPAARKLTVARIRAVLTPEDVVQQSDIDKIVKATVAELKRELPDAILNSDRIVVNDLTTGKPADPTNPTWQIDSTLTELLTLARRNAQDIAALKAAAATP